MTVSTGPWFVNFEPLTEPRLRLICFPYAGASAAVFRSFADVEAGCEVWAVNLPGHGSRLLEAPASDLKQLAQTLAQEVGRADDQPFAFLGHSLGARLAFEVARVLRREKRSLPLHFAASGAAAPQLPTVDRGWTALSDAQLPLELAKYGGVNREILDQPELLALFLPGLRADLEMMQTAEYEDERPFDFAITALGGFHDPLVSEAEVRAWQAQTTGTFRAVLLDSDHFFLQDARAIILKSLLSGENV